MVVHLPDEHADAAARFALIEPRGSYGEGAMETVVNLISDEGAAAVFNDTMWEVGDVPSSDMGMSREFAVAFARNLNRAIALILPSEIRRRLLEP